MTIPMTPVSSSNIAGFGYDPASKTLAVQFANGRTYLYDDVPQEVHEGFVEADSKGSFFAREVRTKFTGVLQKEDAERGG